MDKDTPPSDLKSCPFCGKDAEYAEEVDHHGGYFSLGCGDCECVAYHAYYTQPLEDKYGCIAAWNRRAPAPSGSQEPVGWVFQHNETGRTTFIDMWELENSPWEKGNPRWHRAYPCYRHPAPSHVQPVQDKPQAFCAHSEFVKCDNCFATKPVKPQDYLTWWTSIETDERKGWVRTAMARQEYLHALVRKAYEAGQTQMLMAYPEVDPDKL